MISNTQLLEQNLEDLAGEEIGEYSDDFELDAEFSKLSEVDEFVDIDLYH